MKTGPSDEVGQGVRPTPDSAQYAPQRLRWLRNILLLLGPFAVAVVAGYVYYTGGHSVSTDNAYIKADTVMIAAEVPGVIEHVAVHENQRVDKGDVLFRIDSEPYRIALAKADAMLATARAEIADLKAKYRQKAAELALARSNADFAETAFKRQSQLVKTSTVSRSKFDSTAHDLNVARQTLQVLDQEQAQILAQLEGDADILPSAHSKYIAANAARDQAQLDIDRTVVKAPFAGIASNTPQIGQQVIGNSRMSVPVMSIVADTGVWIVANFKETDLTHVTPGRPVTIQVDTYPEHEWVGIVQSISQATGAEFSIIPPQNATGNWVKIVQRIPVRISVKVYGGDPMLRAGMSVTVEVGLGGARDLPAFLQTALHWFRLAMNARATGTETHQ